MRNAAPVACAASKFIAPQESSVASPHPVQFFHPSTLSVLASNTSDEVYGESSHLQCVKFKGILNIHLKSFQVTIFLFAQYEKFFCLLNMELTTLEAIA